MIMMPYGWTLDIAAAHRSGRLLAPHRPRRSRMPTAQNQRSRARATGGNLRAAAQASPQVV